MATGQKRRAEEQLTPNSVPVLEVVEMVPQINQSLYEPTFFERMRQNVGGALTWITAPIISISNTLYTLTHRNVEIVAETHIQQVIPRADGITSIKRRKTKRTQLPKPKPKPRRREPIFSTHPLDRHRKGGRGVVDYTGCITERDFEQRAEQFWLPPEFTRVRRQSLPGEEDTQKSQEEQNKIAPFPAGNDTIMVDVGEDHDEEALLSDSEDGSQDSAMSDPEQTPDTKPLRNPEPLQPLRQGWQWPQIRSMETRTSNDNGKENDEEQSAGIAMNGNPVVKMEEPLPGPVPTPPPATSQREQSILEDVAKMQINETSKMPGPYSAENPFCYTDSDGKLRLTSEDRARAKAAPPTMPKKTGTSLDIFNKDYQRMKEHLAKPNTIEEHMNLKRWSVHNAAKMRTTKEMTSVDVETVLELEEDFDCSMAPKHEPRHGELQPSKGILKKESGEASIETKKQVHVLTPSSESRAKRLAFLEKRREKEKKDAAEARKKARLSRRTPTKDLVQPLSKEWKSKVGSVLQNTNTITTSLLGTPLALKDFSTLLGSHAWLNDEIINTYIEWIVEAANDAATAEAKAAGEAVSTIPKFIAHNSFFFDNLNKKGVQSTERLMKRKFCPRGPGLLEVDTVFIPICRGSHWTIGVVRPCAKTIEYFDSMGGGSQFFIKPVHEWLKFMLGKDYKRNEWTEPKTKCAVQNNGYDCGVFVCTNALCVAAGFDTTCYHEAHMYQQRRNIAAILMNRGFVGDFAWEQLCR